MLKVGGLYRSIDPRQGVLFVTKISYVFNKDGIVTFYFLNNPNSLYRNYIKDFERKTYEIS